MKRLPTLLLIIAPAAMSLAPAVGQQVVVGKTTQGSILALSFSPDGKRLAAGGLDATVWLWDLTKADEQAVAVRLGKTVRGLAFAPDGKQVAALTDGGLVTVLDMGNAKAVREFRVPRAFGRLAFAPDGGAVAVGGAERTDGGRTRAVIGVFDVVSGKEQWATRTDGDDGIRDLALAPDGKAVATIGGKGLTLWDATTGRPGRTFDPGPGPKPGLGFGPGLVAVAAGKWVLGWDPATGKEVFRADAHGDQSTCVAVSPDGKRVASGGRSGLQRAGQTSGLCVEVAVWDAATGKPVWRHDPGPDEFGSVWAVAFAPDGKALAVATEGRLLFFDAGTGKPGRLLLTTVHELPR
jgi:WD40 repeat protein